MRGITSQAMVMCAVSEDRGQRFFEVLDAPNGSVPGDRVVFDGFPGEPDEQLNPKRKVNVANNLDKLSTLIRGKGREKSAWGALRVLTVRSISGKAGKSL